MVYGGNFYKIATLAELFVKSAWWWIEMVWVAGFVTVLFVNLFDFYPPGIGTSMMLILLTLPLGVIAFFLYPLAELFVSLFAGFVYLYYVGIESFVSMDGNTFDSLLANDASVHLRFIILWGWFFVVGYLQWFILVPRLASWCRNIIIHFVQRKKIICYDPAEKENSKQGELTRDAVRKSDPDIKAMWIATSMMVLFFTVLFLVSAQENISLELFLEGSMLILSFPMGYICTFIPAVFSSLLDVGIESLSRWHLVLALFVYWSLFFVIGYLQWFIVFSRLVPGCVNMVMRFLVPGCINMVAGITKERVSGWLRPVKIVWMVTGVMVLVATLYYFYRGDENSNAGIFLAWSMLILTFPVGYICMSVTVGLLYYLHHLGMIEPLSYYGMWGSYLSLTLYWLLFFMIGYWQWFIMLPRLVPRILSVVTQLKERNGAL